MRKTLFKWILANSIMLFTMHLYADITPPRCYPYELQQSVRSISGQVTDEQGEPIIGVNVIIKGTSTGTITDINGHYTLQDVPSNSTLQFSYIGYTPQEVKVADQATIKVVLKEDAIALNDVVVVGYGTQKKNDVLASIGTINAKDLARSTSTTTSGALVGKVAGLSNRQASGTPGSSASIEIRNMGTPLYVIDGIIKDEGNFNNLNFNDIESVSIIKDGAAAIYGVKAANGVVLVKTKQGSKGKTSIALNYYMGWQSWTRFPDLANATEYTRADYERRINSGMPVDIEKAKSELSKWEAGYYDPATGEDYRGYDWTSFLKNNAPKQYYNVTASGGSKNVNFYLSVAHLDEDAVFEDYNFNRTNFQTNVDAQITKQLKVGVNMSGRIETRRNPGLSGDDDYEIARFSLYRALPTQRPYANDNPDYPAYLPEWKEFNLATLRDDIAGTYKDVWRVFDSNWYVEWQTPLKGLTSKFIYSYYYAGKKRDNFERAYDLYRYDYANKEYVVAGRKESSWMQRQFETAEDKNYQFTLNYDNQFGPHHVSGIFAIEGRKRTISNTQLAQNPVDNNFLPVLTNNAENIAYLHDTYETRATAGIALRASYDYSGRYLIEFAGRYDGSSAFPKHKRWGFFPSISAGWRISEEKFFQESPVSGVFNNLKLRISYGETGDDNLGTDYAYLDYLNGYSFDPDYAKHGVIAGNPWSDISGSYIRGSRLRGISKDQITWCISKMYNIGIDLGFFNNRLTSEIDVFKRKRTGLLADNPKAYLMPEETGISVPGINGNSDEIKGMDGFVKWQDHIRNFSYSAGANIGYARKKNCRVVGYKFFNSWDEYRWNTNNRYANVYGEAVTWAAKVIGQFKSQEEIDSYPVVMDNQGNRTVLPGDFIYEDINKDGVINDYDNRPLGYGENLPVLTFGFNLGFSWKGIDFAADFTGASMQTLVLNYESKWPFQKQANSPAYMLNDRWHHEDIFDPTSPWVPGSRPALRYDSYAEGGSYYRWNSYFMQNISYLRLKNIEIGYTLPKAWTEKLAIEKFRIFVTGTNLFSFDNMKKFGLDPEQAENNGVSYPVHRVYTVGFNLNF